MYQAVTTNTLTRPAITTTTNTMHSNTMLSNTIPSNTTPATTSSQPAMFAFFAFLPAELRLQIWREACETRVVEVRYDAAQDLCHTQTQPPAILQVNAESRHEGLRLYRCLFGTRAQPDGRIYFCPDLDVLYWPRARGMIGYGDDCRDFSTLVLNTAPLVQRLAVDHVRPEIRRPWETYNKFCLMRNFDALREAYLVLGPGEGDDNYSYSNYETYGSRTYGHGRAEKTTYSGRHIEFVDPREDKATIMKLMDDVRQSFSFEVGCPVWLGCDGADDTTGQNAAADADVLQLPLIPKRKVSYPDIIAGTPMFVACV
jgi:hypothetical protein